jgi:uncharacterized protein (TIGR02117 family)
MNIARAGVLLCILLGACAAPGKNSVPAEDAVARKPVYLVSHGWHSGIVVRRADLPAGVWPESADFPEAEYLEIGWGDRDFYPAAEFGWGIALKAALWPTPSVLHMVGFSGPVTDYFPHSEVVELELSQRDFERLSGFVHNRFDRNGAPRAIRLRAGLYGQSAFYPARGKFHLFNTCNVWTARALRTAGLPVTPFYAITTDSLMSQVRQSGKTLQPWSSGH